MDDTILTIKTLMVEVSTRIMSLSPEEQEIRPAPGKWSKKEILGHLVDSAINNLKRFTEIQFMPRPYTVTKYKQAELVTANNYQGTQTDQIIHLWLSLNQQILNVIALQTEDTLAYPVILPEGDRSDLRFLIADYAEHMEHHARQIKG